MFQKGRESFIIFLTCVCMVNILSDQFEVSFIFPMAKTEWTYDYWCKMLHCLIYISIIHNANMAQNIMSNFFPV